MASTYIADYLGRGLASARPVTPPVGTAIAWYLATDTGALSFWNGTAWVTQANISLTGANSWVGAQRGVPVNLIDAATIAVDLSAANNFALTISGNRTLGNPTNIVAGQGGQIVVTQGAGGSHTLSYASDWKFAGGSAPVLSTAAGAIDILSYFVISTTAIALIPSLNYS